MYDVRGSQWVCDTGGVRRDMGDDIHVPVSGPGAPDSRDPVETSDRNPLRWTRPDDTGQRRDRPRSCRHRSV